MSGHKDSFQDRRARASSARNDALKSFKERPGADDPAVVQRRSERMILAAARQERDESRRQAKAAEAALKQELADAEAAARLKIEDERRAAEAEAKLKEKPVLTDEEKKAARDARYAARKARR